MKPKTSANTKTEVTPYVKSWTNVGTRRWNMATAATTEPHRETAGYAKGQQNITNSRRTGGGALDEEEGLEGTYSNSKTRNIKHTRHALSQAKISSESMDLYTRPSWSQKKETLKIKNHILLGNSISRLAGQSNRTRRGNDLETEKRVIKHQASERYQRPQLKHRHAKHDKKKSMERK